MTAQADVCNQALSSIGARGVITSLDEPSKGAIAFDMRRRTRRHALLLLLFLNELRGLIVVGAVLWPALRHVWPHR